MPDTVAVVVARGRYVSTHAGTHGPGSSLDMPPDEAALLAERGFVRLAGQEVVEPRTIRVQDTSPDRVGLQTRGSAILGGAARCLPDGCAVSQAITRPPAATPDDGEVTITAAGSVLPVLNVGHGVGSSEMLPGGF